MIVLKNLANEFNQDPYSLRMRLRKQFGIRRRWRWDEADPLDAHHLKEVREFLKKAIAGDKKPS